MRKLAACFLLVFYVLVSAASGMDLHYCAGGWMTGFNMMRTAAHVDHGHCPACHQRHQDDDCCKHPKIQVKINPNQLLPATYDFHWLSFVAVLTFSPLTIPQDRVAEGAPLFLPAHAPPQWFATANTRQAFYGIFLI